MFWQETWLDQTPRASSTVLTTSSMSQIGDIKSTLSPPPTAMLPWTTTPSSSTSPARSSLLATTSSHAIPPLTCSPSSTFRWGTLPIPFVFFYLVGVVNFSIYMYMCITYLCMYYSHVPRYFVPKLMYLYIRTETYVSIHSYRNLCTNAIVPKLIYWYIHTKTYVLIYSYINLCTNAFVLRLMYQYNRTTTFLPKLMYQYIRAETYLPMQSHRNLYTNTSYRNFVSIQLYRNLCTNTSYRVCTDTSY